MSILCKLNVGMSMWRSVLWLALAWVLTFQVSCDNTVTPGLKHLKRPLSLAPAFVDVSQCRAANATIGEAFCRQDSDCDGGKTCVAEGRRYYMYIANADLDRLSVVWTLSSASGDSVFNREHLIDPSPTSPGVLYIPTGRYPVDVVTAPDQKRVFVLHGIDGDLMVIDPQTQKPAVDKDGNALRFPEKCQDNDSCWQNPSRLLLYPTDSGLMGFVLVPSERVVVVVDLNESSATYGKETKRIALDGLPNQMFFDPQQKNLYVTNSTKTAIDMIDPKALTKSSFDVGRATLGGAISHDLAWLYLIDMETGGILIYGLNNKKIVQQGDSRYPERITIQPDANVSVLNIAFFPVETFVTVTDTDGQQASLKGAFALATASDGYAYLIDITKHKLFNADLRGPAASTFRVYVGEEAFGDAREPTRNTLPKIRRANSDDTGVKLVADRVVSETWTLTYNKTFISDRNGRFSDLKNGEFIERTGFDLASETVQKGDVLILQDCKEETKEGGETVSVACEFPILEAVGARLKIDVSQETPPEKDQWTFSIRTHESYLVEGSVSGKQELRATDGALYKNDFFELQISAGKEDTPTDTKFEFTIDARFTMMRLALGGLPSKMIIARDRLPCTGDTEDCKRSYCTNHPLCRKTQCAARSSDDATNEQLKGEGKICGDDEVCDTDSGTCTALVRLWVLDPSGSQLFVVKSEGELTRETPLQ